MTIDNDPSNGLTSLDAKLASEGENIAQDAVDGMAEWFQWRSQLAVILAMREKWQDLQSIDPNLIQQTITDLMRKSVSDLRSKCEDALQKLEALDGNVFEMEQAMNRQMPRDPENRTAPFDLPVLRVTLSKDSGDVAGSGTEARNSKPGDYLEVVGEQVHFKPGSAFSIYNLASLLPLLAGAQHAKDPNDWFTKLRHIRSVDPSCGSKFDFERLGPITFMLNEVENVSVQEADSQQK
jgi:hypothetical protein